MPTIEDVARRAGVSRSTVSLVLNRSPKVKEETRRLVERVIEEIRYVPNINARSLSSRVTNNLGIVFMQDYLPTDMKISYDNDQHVGMYSFNISNGIMAGLAGTDYGVLTERFCSIAAPDDLPRIIQEKRVDGLFVVGHPYSSSFLSNLQKTGIPFVTVGVGGQAEGFDTVSSDPYTGTCLAMEELIRTGHRRICLMNAPVTVRSHQPREAAYRSVLEKHGLPCETAWIMYPEKNNGSCARAVFESFWRSGSRPDGMVTANGQSACGVMSFLYEQGVRVPDDLSIIAYEDSSVCGYAAPALTAVNIRKEEMGSIAARCLLERLRDPNAQTKSYSTQPYLVQRSSVKPR